MTDAEKLAHELETCRLAACKCSVCKEKPDCLYEVGVTVLRCKCPRTVALPDWNSRTAKIVWNRCFAADKWTTEHIQKIINDELSKKDLQE